MNGFYAPFYKIGEKSLSRFEYLLASKEKTEENRSEIIKYSAKIEFIKEIFEQAKQNQPT